MSDHPVAMADTTAQESGSDTQSARITNQNISATQPPGLEAETDDDEGDLILTVRRVLRPTTTDQVVFNRTDSNQSTRQVQGSRGLNEQRMSTFRTSNFTFEHDPSADEEAVDMTDRAPLEMTTRSVLTNRVPHTKYHEALHCWTGPGITQTEFDKRATVSPNLNRDEVITVVCPDSETPYEGFQTYMVNRSALLRSPTLADLFYSPDYLYGCDFTLRFINDPSAAFEIVVSYLNMGPDRYTCIRMQSEVTLEYDIGIDRLLIFAKAHLFAKKLALPGLMNMAYQALLESDGLMRASYCTGMATHIFEVNGHFDRTIKDWLLKYIGSYFAILLDNEEWKRLVPSLDPDINHHWSRMVHANASMLAALDNEPNQNVLWQIEDLPQQDQAGASSTLEGNNQEKSAMDLLIEAEMEMDNEMRERGNAQGWIDEDLPESSRLRGHQVYDDTKARRVLGIIDSSGGPLESGGPSGSAPAKNNKKGGRGVSVEDSPSKPKSRFYGKRLLKFKGFGSRS